jgi:outer membrane protein TolC
MRAMRFEQQISACSRGAGAAALAVCLFASGRQVFASGQAGPAPQPPAAPTAALPGPVLKLTSEEAVRMALENNLGIQAERLGPQIGTLGVAQARAAYKPTLFSNTLTRSSTNPPDFLSSGGQTSTVTGGRNQTSVGVQQFVPWGGGRYSLSLDASRGTTSGISSFNPQLGSNLAVSYQQPLLRNFRMDPLRQQVLVSRKNEEIADIQLRQQITVTDRTVRSVYYDLVGAIAGLEVARQSLELANELLKNNQRKVEVGTLAPIDILEAQAEVSSNEEAVINAESRIRSVEDRLRALIMNPNQTDFWTMRLEPTEQPVMAPTPIDIDAAVENALKNRTDIAQVRKRMETTDINLAYARDQKMPAVDVSANYNTVGVAGTQYNFGDGFPPTVLGQSQRSFGDALRDVFGNQFKTWSLQVNVSYPIGTSAAEANLAATRLQKQQEQTALRDLEMQIATSVRDAGRQVSTNLKRVEATRNARDFAQKRYDAEQKRMAVGLSTTFQLFQAQRDLARQRQNELTAIIDYNRALVNFRAVQSVPVQ